MFNVPVFFTKPLGIKPSFTVFDNTFFIGHDKKRIAMRSKTPTMKFAKTEIPIFSNAIRYFALIGMYFNSFQFRIRRSVPSNPKPMHKAIPSSIMLPIAITYFAIRRPYKVFFDVFRSVQYLKVFNSIIQFIVVYMMNYLIRIKFSTKMLFHHISVIAHWFSFNNYSSITNNSFLVKVTRFSHIKMMILLTN